MLVRSLDQVATRHALTDMISWLVTHMGLTPMEALVVCSAAADFKIAEVVDMPKYALEWRI